jgi:hypothetical protein
VRGAGAVGEAAGAGAAADVVDDAGVDAEGGGGGADITVRGAEVVEDGLAGNLGTGTAELLVVDHE